MYVLPQEKDALETFSGQRDELMREVSLLQIEKDKLNSEIKELLHSVTSTRDELDTLNELMKAQLKGEGAVSEQIKNSIATLKKETEYIQGQKDQATIELHERIAFLRDTAHSVEVISKEIAQLQNSMSGVYKDMHNASTWMKESVVEIKQILESAREDYKKFTEDFVAHEQKAAERIQYLDNKEKLIAARERAVSDKYTALVEKAKEGLN